jgi:apolipoprotein N-acyltransferase
LRFRSEAALLVGAGVIAALSVAPFGWWVLAPPALGVLGWRLQGAGWRRRIALGALFFTGLFGVGLFWAIEFTLPGTFVFVAVMVALTALPMALVPEGGGAAALVAFPAAVTLGDALRSRWPVEGLPLSGLDLGQARGPLAAAAGVGGRLLLVALVAVLGTGCAALYRRHRAWWRAAAGSLVVVVAVAGLSHLGPDGAAVGQLTVGAVQGGGPRGIPDEEADDAAVFQAHVAATELLGSAPIDLILWPEDVVDIVQFAGSPEEATLQALARRHRATLIAGIVEDAPNGRFRNAAVAFGPDGRLVDRYDKVRRVPFGEYFPLRSIIENLATIPARDAVPGRGPGVLRTPAGTFAVLISYEGFFPDRVRTGVHAGGTAVLIPTNASSFTTTQMPAQQVAAARIRARETGRWVLQAGPTGFSAVITPSGHLVRQTRLGARQVLRATIELRRGETLFVRFGDGPTVLVALIALAISWRVAKPQRRVPSASGPTSV